MTQESKLRYLNLLSAQYPSIQSVSNKIIALSAQLQLPKCSEHFLSDIHGEHDAFQHVIRNGAGSLRRKIEELFSQTLSKQQRRNLATLIYYPRQKTTEMLQTVEDPEEWIRLSLVRLIKLCRVLVSKYQRSEVRIFIPADAAPIVEELLLEQEHYENRSAFYHKHLEAIIATGSGSNYIVLLAELIQNLAIARLHVIGDIYDRGNKAHLIMDALMKYHHVDLQWGNHDILWMGAASGSEVCIANVVRNCLQYANMETLETGYGISLLPLASFALDVYAKDHCERFVPKVADHKQNTAQEIRLMGQMLKAISIIQFKLEGQIIKRRPQYNMDDRLLLEYIDYGKGSITIDKKEYKLLDTNFPTIDPKDPYKLTAEEQTVMEKFGLSFANSEKLQQHVRFLYSKGSIYLIHDGNLLYHGCIAMNDDGSFKSFNVDGQGFAGKAFMDRVDRLARQGYFSTADQEKKQYGMDAMWYLWCGEQSPLFGKAKMTTFERYFIEDKATHEEKRNAYYTLRDQAATIKRILEEFGVDPEKGHVINGHVPVKVKKGERPVKAGGKLIVIDGGFSKAYQKETGIAGYTLISNSFGLLLAAHQPFESMQKAVSEDVDVDTETEIIESFSARMRVKDTDCGKMIKHHIADLQELLNAYRSGWIKEK